MSATNTYGESSGSRAWSRWQRDGRILGRQSSWPPVAAAGAGGQYGVLYGRCAGQCDRDASWMVVALPLESSTSAVPTIALTQEGRPRILLGSSLGPAPGFHYLECDAACEQAASWK